MKFNSRIVVPIIISSIILLTVIAMSFAQVNEANQGTFVYGLDDPYIHMSVARNFADYGVWGLTRFEFSSPSSSLIFPLLLALGYKLTGNMDLWPLIINVLAGISVLILVTWVLERNGAGLKTILATLIITIFVAPMPHTIMVGMEHLIHSFFMIAFCYIAAEILETGISSRQKLILFFCSTILLTATRYEGLFVIAMVCGLLILRFRFLMAVATGFFGSVAIVVFGIISVNMGSLFLPNSIYLKGDVNNPHGILGQLGRLMPDKVLWNLYQTLFLWPLLLTILLAMVLYFINRRKGSPLWWTKSNILVALTIGSIIMHMQFSNIYQMRYEVYLVCLIVLVNTLLLMEIFTSKAELRAIIRVTMRKRKAVFYTLLLMFLLPLFATAVYFRSVATSFRIIAPFSNNIYSQQYQMGLFVREYYPNSAFALNDIGAVSYLNEAPILDLWGLSSVEVARLGGYLNIEADAAWDLFAKHDVHYAIIYDEWVERLIPPNWVEVATWTIDKKWSVAFVTVHFYAASDAEGQEMLRNLQAFESKLPPNVTVEYTLP